MGWSREKGERSGTFSKNKKGGGTNMGNMGNKERARAWPRRTLTLIVCAGLVLSTMLLPVQGAAQQKAGQPKTLRIGYVLELSGWYSIMDASEDRYLKATAQMINEKGGVTVQGQNYAIELVGEDGKSTLDGNTAAANKLVFDDKVNFVLGPAAFYNPATSPVFEPNKVFHVASFVVMMPGELDATTPYGFIGYNSSIGVLMGALKAMKKEFPSVKKVVMVAPDDGALPHLMPKAKKALEGLGLTEAGSVIAFPNEMEDFNPIAAKINAVKDADAIVVVNGSPPATGGIAKGLRALRNKKPIICSAASGIEDIAAICGKAAANDIISMAIAPHAKGNPPLIDELFDRAGKKMPILVFTANGLWVLTQVIQAANSLDPAVIKAKWETMDKVECVYGTCTFGGDETYGLKHHAISHPQPYTKLVNGKVVEGGWVDVGRIP
jgi:branched-chain amino acid transport system substrate-binding protein